MASRDRAEDKRAAPTCPTSARRVRGGTVAAATSITGRRTRRRRPARPAAMPGPAANEAMTTGMDGLGRVKPKWFLN